MTEETLREQGVDEGLIHELSVFRDRFSVDESQKRRMAKPVIPFY